MAAANADIGQAGLLNLVEAGHQKFPGTRSALLSQSSYTPPTGLHRVSRTSPRTCLDPGPDRRYGKSLLVFPTRSVRRFFKPSRLHVRTDWKSVLRLRVPSMKRASWLFG